MNRVMRYDTTKKRNLVCRTADFHFRWQICRPLLAKRVGGTELSRKAACKNSSAKRRRARTSSPLASRDNCRTQTRARWSRSARFAAAGCFFRHGVSTTRMARAAHNPLRPDAKLWRNCGADRQAKGYASRGRCVRGESDSTLHSMPPRAGSESETGGVLSRFELEAQIVDARRNSNE